MGIELAYEIEGVYWAEVHNGHTFNEAGELIREGDVLRRSGKGKNKILLSGFNFMGVNDHLTLTAVAGSGNAPVTEADTVLGSFKGYTNTLISHTKTVNSTPDASGYVYHRSLYRFSFAPGALGSTPINISEAGMAVTHAPNAATQLLSRGLLVDGVNAPTSVSLDPATEFLDLYWEVTYYVKAETTASINLTIDGVNTPFDIVIRPTDFLNAQTVKPWVDVPGSKFPCFGVPIRYIGGNAFSSCRALSGPIGNLTEIPTGDYSAGGNSEPTTSTSPAYIAGSKQRTHTLTWQPDRGNVSGGIGAVTVLLNSSTSGGMGYWGFQVSYTPKILKINTKRLDLDFTFSLVNR